MDYYIDIEKNTEIRKRRLLFLDPISALPFFTYGTDEGADLHFKQTIILFCDKAIQLYFKDSRDQLTTDNKTKYDKYVVQCLVSMFYPVKNEGQFIETVATSIYSLLFNPNTLDLNTKVYQKYILQKTQKFLEQAPTEHIDKNLFKLKKIKIKLDGDITIVQNQGIINITIKFDDSMGKEDIENFNLSIYKQNEGETTSIKVYNDTIQSLSDFQKISEKEFQIGDTIQLKEGNTKYIIKIDLDTDFRDTFVFEKFEYRTEINIQNLPSTSTGIGTSGTVSSSIQSRLRTEASQERSESLYNYLEKEFVNVKDSVEEQEKDILNLIEGLINNMKASTSGGGKTNLKNKKQKNNLENNNEIESDSESEFDFETFTKKIKIQKGGNTDPIETKLIKIGHYIRKLSEIELNLKEFKEKEPQSEAAVLWKLEETLQQREVSATDRSAFIQLQNELNTQDLTSTFKSKYIDINSLTESQSVEDK